MQGYSGTYAVGGTDIPQPTTHQWANPTPLGFDGNGRPIYPAIKEYELGWNLLSATDLETLIQHSEYSLLTGTVVVDLPRWGDDFIFQSYSGTYIQRPSVGTYFTDHVNDVRLIVSNIRTG